MAQRKYIEREVELMFDNEWKVVKFDEHRYYRQLSGYGLKAVDFLAIHVEMGVAFIEMKNYTNGRNSIPDQLDGVMKEKRDDSIRLISIINKYYQRQWYFRLIKKIGWQRLIPEEWKVWLLANQHVENGNYFFLGIIDH